MPRWLHRSLFVVPLAASLLAAPADAAARDDVVRRWNRIAIDASGLDHTPVVPPEVRSFGEQLGPGRSSRAMAIAHVAKVVAFGFIGFAIGSYVPLMAAMIATGAIGNWLGEIALLRTSERRFRLVFQLVLTLLGLRLLWGAAAGAGWV